MQVRKQQLELDMERQTGSKKEKEYVKAIWTSLVAQTVKRLSTMRETWVLSLGREDLLEKEMATHSNILAWRIPGTGEPGGLPYMGLHRVRHD